MSQATASADQVKSDLCVLLLRGRIVGKSRQYKTKDGERRFATVLRLPNPDEFTSLGSVEVHSVETLGEDGDSWAGRARLTGSVRTFDYQDRNTGDKKSGREFAAKLTVL